MEWFFYVICICIIIDIESKLGTLLKNQNVVEKKKNMTHIMKDLVGKKVTLIIDNEDIQESYLFSSSVNTIGVIKEYNDTWLLFEYENKKETVQRYFRICDITSINEIKKIVII